MNVRLQLSHVLAVSRSFKHILHFPPAGAFTSNTFNMRLLGQSCKLALWHNVLAALCWS